MAQHFKVVSPCHRKVEIVSSTFEEFLTKCRTKYKFKEKESITVCLDDGTEVDRDHFEVLTAGTELHVMPSAEYRTPDIIGPLATFLHACLQRQPKIHEKVSMYLQEPKFSTQATELLDLLTKVARDVAPESSKDRDYEWFKGLDTSYKTKEDVMRNSADRRMRGYLMHTKTELNKDRQLPAVSSYNQAVEFLKNQLSINKYNAKYFDRKAAPGERLCDANGLFECEGPYNTDRCPGIHFINPYASREMRIMFSTWNLDHMRNKNDKNRAYGERIMNVDQGNFTPLVEWDQVQDVSMPDSWRCYPKGSSSPEVTLQPGWEADCPLCLGLHCFASGE